MTHERARAHRIVETWIRREMGPDRNFRAWEILENIPLMVKWGAMSRREAKIATYILTHGEVM